MLYKKQKTQPFAIQVYKFKPQQKKKPPKRGKKGYSKRRIVKILVFENVFSYEELV
jgi:hypothetical protein